MNRNNLHPWTVKERDINGELPVGAWCFLMDLPEIKDPPKYREVTAADVGREIEVKATGGFSKGYKCFGVSRSGAVAFELENGGYGTLPSSYCRILDDGEPAKQPLIFNLAIGDSCEMGGEEFRLTGRTKHTEVDAAGNRERVCTLRFVRELPAS